MKRILLLLIALAMLVPTAMAEGNLLLKTGESNYIQSLLTDGETLYAVGDNVLYAWRAGEPELTEYSGEAIPVSGPGLEADMTCYLYEFRFYADADGLHGLRVDYDEDYLPRGFQIFDFALGDGGALGATLRASLGASDFMDPETYVNALCADGGRLYLLTDGGGGTTVTVVDPENPRRASTEQVESWQCALLPDRDGALLANWDYGSEEALILSRINDDASLDELCRLPTGARAVALDPDTGALYAAIQGKVCPVDPATGAVGEAVAALPTVPDYAVVMNGGKTYAANMGGYLAVLDTEGRLSEDAVLTISAGSGAEWLDRAVIEYSVEHPQIAPCMDHEHRDILKDVTTQSPDTDIYLITTDDGGAYESLVKRGFMLPLDGSAALSALAARIYPNLLKKLSCDGALAALPVNLYGNGMGMSAELLDKMGIDADDVPRTWPAFLDFMENELKSGLSALGERAQFTYDGMNAEDFRYFMIQRALNDFTQASDAAGGIPNFEDPRLVETLERLCEIDFTEYGLPEKQSDDAGYGYGWNSETRYLLQFDADYLFGSGMLDCVPVPLGFGDDLPGVLSLNVTVAFVNPYSNRQAEAMAFLEAMAAKLPDELLYALCPDLNEPVRQPEADRMLADYQKWIDEWTRDVESAEPSMRQQMQDTLEGIKREAEEYAQRGCWLISQERLDWYRANADKLNIAAPSWFQKDTSGESWQLLEQYNAGQLSTREFLAAVNKKARMMAMEEG